MANPRQRRKSRSSSKAVTQSLRSRKNMRKAPVIKGPKVLQDAWDRKKTLRQNYAALGLMHNLNPFSSGGSEIDIHSLPQLPEVEISPAGEVAPSSSGIKKGFGRIIRDEAGNIVDVELADDENGGSSLEEVRDTADGSDEWEGVGATSEWVQALSRREGGADTGVVQELERVAASTAPVIRFTSAGEQDYLVRLTEAHGADVDAMSRDRRLNVDQKTAGQLSRALRKAGLLSTA